MSKGVHGDLPGTDSHNYRHGHSIDGKTSKEYTAWAGMRDRCFNPLNRQYKDYGDRGITVCARWDNSFENFLEDMGLCPLGLTLHREDNEDIYTPRNCVWATRLIQQQATRRNRFVEIEGVTKCLLDWCRVLGVRPTTIYGRVTKLGMSWVEALTTPKMVAGRRKKS